MSVTNDTILPPPVERYSALGWLRRNLFQTWTSGLVSIVLSYFIFVVARAVVVWVVRDGQWGVVAENLQLLMIGQYPRIEAWRIWICVGMMAFLVSMSWGIWIRQRVAGTSLVVGLPLILAVLPFDSATRMYWLVIGAAALVGYGLGRLSPRVFRRVANIGWLVFIPLVLMLVRGFEGASSPISYVTSNLWGGLLLTALIGGIGTALSFPIGVVLAIGRRSRYPVIRAFCVVYIELIRSVPLITVLFMAQTMLPLFLPSNIEIDRVVRAITAFTLFSAAYMAENVRGGLQNIPKGQYEAAMALGLNSLLSLRLIILPQALRSIIPILTASVIGSFRDTSLVLIVGLLDLLGIAKAALAQPAFLGRHIEVYSFLAAVYWAISYAFSYIGQIIEERVGINSQRN